MRSRLFRLVDTSSKTHSLIDEQLHEVFNEHARTRIQHVYQQMTA